VVFGFYVDAVFTFSLIYHFSIFDTDYVLVKDWDIKKTIAALKHSGHKILTEN
jgi:hypothetical protein